jgi:hypothetical protein
LDTVARKALFAVPVRLPKKQQPEGFPSGCRLSACSEFPFSAC